MRKKKNKMESQRKKSIQENYGSDISDEVTILDVTKYLITGTHHFLVIKKEVSENIDEELLGTGFCFNCRHDYHFTSDFPFPYTCSDDDDIEISLISESNHSKEKADLIMALEAEIKRITI